jgi:hypothetical protein
MSVPDQDRRIREALSTLDEAYASHVVYEYRMLRLSFVGLQDTVPGTPTHIIHLEAFALHYRILLDFFLPVGRTEPSDILARDFIGENVSIPGDRRKDLNRWLAHLTKDRIGVFLDMRKGWPVIEMLRDVEKAWQEFLANLGDVDAARVAWFTDPQLRSDELPPSVDIDLEF